jgi:hypothetical protein
MSADSRTLPVPTASSGGIRISILAQLALIPEEDIWLAKQKSPRTRRAYRQDVAHFMSCTRSASPASTSCARPTTRR